MTNIATYTGPRADQVAQGLTALGFPAQRNGNRWRISTAVCHPQAGGANLNLEIRDGRNALLVTCFSDECPPSLILDQLEALGFAVRQYSDGRHAPGPTNPAPTPVPRPIPRPSQPQATSKPPAPFPFDLDKVLSAPRQIARALNGTTDGPPYWAQCPACGQALRLWSEGSGNGLRARCQCDCPYARIIAAITRLGWVLRRAYFYELINRQVLKRIRWDYDGNKTYRGAGTLDVLNLKLWPPDHIDNTILVVEGEKAAEAVASAGLSNHGYTVATWLNGTSNAYRVNLAHYAGRRLILWPDDGTTSRKAMVTIAQNASEHDCAVCVIPNEGESDTDAADYRPSSLLRIISTAQPV